MLAGFLGFQAKQTNRCRRERTKTGDRHSYRGDGGQQEAAWIKLVENPKVQHENVIFKIVEV